MAILRDGNPGSLAVSAVAEIQVDPVRALTATATVVVPDGWSSSAEGSTAVLIPQSWGAAAFVPNVVMNVGPSSELSDGDIEGSVLATAASEVGGARRTERSVIAHDLGIPIAQHALTIEEPNGAVMSVVCSVGTFDWEHVRSIFGTVLRSATLVVEPSEEASS